MSKHTPAPWRIEGRFVLAMKTKSICEIPMGGIIHGKVDKANACLIAAAPDLLEALQALIDMDVAYQRGPKVEDAVERARAAIAKATGGSL